MGWLRSIVSPLRKLWCNMNTVPRKSMPLLLTCSLFQSISVLSISDVWRCLIDRFDFAERGIYILYDDVKSCQCEDVHVLWSILMESHGLPPPTPTTVLRLTR
jgi:hypothetical protein